MATALLDVVIGKLAGIVVEQVANEASILLRFKEDFKWLENELTKVKGYLQYDHEQNEPLKKWFADVQDIALDAEDVVQECAVHHLYGKSLFFQRKIGKRIKKLKERLESIMKDLDNHFKLHQGCQVRPTFNFLGRAEVWKKAGLQERNARPVGIDGKVEQILHLLEDHALQVIAVLGMGGMGKTFLLQNVYNYPTVLQRFEKRIWLSISQVFSVERLQFDIASHLELDLKALGVGEQRAAELIREKLEDKSFLLVLDDVWTVEGLDTLIERLGIPDGTSKSCKVVVTTRSNEVCNIIRAPNIYQMELLSEEDSWNLFCLHAFPDEHQNRPSEELDEVAHQVEKECGRLPLAINTVAASMASQKLLSVWELKLRQLKEVSDPQDSIMRRLRLSYDALPGVLKPCFLYFSFFGEDVEIDAEYLIYLWMGEGFIPQGKEQWSTGWRYLKELNNLCLVEVREDENLKITCKIHDLLLDLIISISRENKCAFTVDEASAVGCRRIFLAKKSLDEADISRVECPKSLRTLSLSQTWIEELPEKSLTGVRALRVIDLSYTSISLLPQCVRNFRLLRVLNLSNMKYLRFEEVPECVRHLKSLWFLRADACYLPKWIGDLKCLQHLHVLGVVYSREMSRGISKLVSLRTLRTICLCGWGRLVLKDVAKLIHLEEVSITIGNGEEVSSLEEGVLAQLVNMRRLTINVFPDFPRQLLLSEKMKAMKDLQYLRLRGFSVGRRISEYGNLRVLELERCELSEWPAVETMANLIKLGIEYCRGCKELGESFGKSGSFPHLRIFGIEGCSESEKLPELHDGAMPRVEEFLVKWCERLQKIPEGLEHLRSLKLLDLSYKNGFSDEERERLKEGGQYWNKIKANNPHVTITM